MSREKRLGKDDVQGFFQISLINILKCFDVMSGPFSGNKKLPAVTDSGDLNY